MSTARQRPGARQYPAQDGAHRLRASAHARMDVLSAGVARLHAADGQLPFGGIGLKIDAAPSFLAACKGEVVITSLEFAPEAPAGRAGTPVVPDA